MAERLTPDICVIGGGSGGLTVAAGASQMGAETVLVERGRMGGDCLNYGCVPSKALIAAGRAARTVRGAARFGVDADGPRIDFARVHAHVHGVIGDIAPHDSVERFEGLGVRVIQASATFTGPQTVMAGDCEIRARRFVIATGSSPATPPIPGIDTVPHFTNETIFERTSAPRHLIVIGGGPIGCELAQAHRHLGARVTLLEMFSILGKDDPELAEIVELGLRRDGVDVRQGVKIARVERDDEGIAITIEQDGAEHRLGGTDLLVAAGRKPNIDGLGLEAAGVDFSPKGIRVDARLRATNRRVFAIGDVAGGPQFTHVAGYHAGIVIRNALFRLPAKVDYRAVPWVTYTTPELAHVGVAEAAAREAHGEIRILRFPFAENDRARAGRDAVGLIKAIATKKGIVVGASIVGPHAGELIQSWILPIQRRMHVKHLAGAILPYPTLGEVNKRAATSFYAPTLFGERTRRLVRFLGKFG